MSKALRVLCFVSVATAIPGLAAAQSPTPFAPTPFDGDYAGVSNTGEGLCSPLVPVPRVLVIENGVAKFQGGFQNRPNLKFQGSVSPQGGLTMKDREFPYSER